MKLSQDNHFANPLNLINLNCKLTEKFEKFAFYRFIFETNNAFDFNHSCCSINRQNQFQLE